MRLVILITKYVFLCLLKNKRNRVTRMSQFPTVTTVLRNVLLTLGESATDSCMLQAQPVAQGFTSAADIYPVIH
jgi:hypothetical protein